LEQLIFLSRFFWGAKLDIFAKAYNFAKVYSFANVFFSAKVQFFAKVDIFAKSDIFANVDGWQKFLHKKVEWHEWHDRQYTNMSEKAGNSETVRGEEEEEDAEGDFYLLDQMQPCRIW
jgi:hypothetical protein